MPVQQFLPDPRLQVFLDFVGQQQLERRRREEERAASRERKNRRLAMVAPLFAKGQAREDALIQGIPALIGAGLGVAGIGGGTALSGALTGARVGQSLQQGDLVGGISAIAAPIAGQQLGIDPLQAALIGPQGIGRLAGQQSLQRGVEARQISAQELRDMSGLASSIGMTGQQLISNASAADVSESEFVSNIAVQQAQADDEAAVQQAGALARERAQATFEQKVANRFDKGPDVEGQKRILAEIKAVQGREDFSPEVKAQRIDELTNEFINLPEAFVERQPTFEQQFQASSFVDPESGERFVPARFATRVGDGRDSEDTKFLNNFIRMTASMTTGLGRPPTADEVVAMMASGMQLREEAVAAAKNAREAAKAPAQAAPPAPSVADQGVPPAISRPDLPPAEQGLAAEPPLTPNQTNIQTGTQAIRAIVEQRGDDVSKWPKEARRKGRQAAFALAQALAQEYGSPENVPIELIEVMKVMLQLIEGK